jgi:hypothetical protein
MCQRLSAVPSKASSSSLTLRKVLLLDVEREKRALEAVQNHLLEIVRGGQAHLRMTQPEFSAHGRIGNEPVVRVHGDAQTQVFVELERVARQVANRSGLNVRRGTALERDSVVGDVVEKVAVLAKAAPVADAMRAADVNGLGDRLGPVGLASVNRDVDVVVAHELEGRLVMLGRVVVLRAGEIEPNDAATLVSNGKLSHLERALGRHVADAADDDIRLDPVLLARLPQAFEHAFDDRRQLEPATGVKHRRIANFHVPDVLAGRVLRQLVGNATQGVLRLHYAQGDLERPRYSTSVPQFSPRCMADRRPSGSPAGSSTLWRSRRTQEWSRAEATVQVDVQVGLGELLDELQGNGGRFAR